MLRSLLHRLRVGHALHGKLSGRRPTYLCSYPKSGRTWLRFIVANYLIRAHDLGIKLDFDTLFHVLPNLSTNLRRGIDAFRFVGDDRIPLMLSSHRAYSDDEFGAGDIVYMLRGIHDVLVSSYFHATHQRRRRRRFTGDIKEYLRSADRGLGRYIAYQNSWAPVLTDRRALVLTYEQLSNGTEETATRVLEFLGVEVRETTLREAVGDSAFEPMQATEIARGIGGQRYDRSEPEARRVRKGKVGGYVDYLDDDDVEYITTRCRAELTPAARGLLSSSGVLE